MKFATTLVLASVLALPALAAEQTLKFLKRGKPVKELSTAELEKISPAKEVTILEPHEEKVMKFKGYEARAILDAVYGKEWRTFEEVLMTCLDGFQPATPAPRFAKLDGYFVTERLDGPFKVTKKKEGNVVVDVGPFYLIWANVKEENIQNWPYQVNTIDLVNSEDRFPLMAPPKTASAAAKRGFTAFRQNCLACHQVNGTGGDKVNFDLNTPVSVTEYWKEAWLKKLLKDPASLRPRIEMPALTTTGKEGDKIIDDIVAYLKVMASNKRTK